MGGRVSKYYLKILAYGILLGAVPLLILGIFFYEKSLQIIQHNVQDAQAYGLTQARMRVEGTLIGVENVTNQFVVSMLVDQAMNQSLNESTFAFNRDLQSAMTRLQTYNLGVDRVLIVNEKYGWALDNGALFELSDSQVPEETKAAYNRLLQKDERSFWALTGNDSNQFIYPYTAANNEQRIDLGVSIVKKLPFLYPESYGILVATIPLYHLNELINVDGSSPFIILDEKGTVLARPDGSDLGEPWQNADISQKLADLERKGSRQGQLTYGDQGQEWGLTYEKSDYNGWTYLSLYSISAATKASRDLAIWIGLIVLVLFALVLVLAMLASRNIYHPLLNLIQLTGLQRDGKQPYNDEFRVIEERMRGLLNNEDQLSEQFRSNMRQLKEWLVLKLLWGEAPAGDLRERMARFGFRSDWTFLAVLCVVVDKFENDRFSEEDQDLILFSVNNIVEELIPSTRRMTPVMINQTQITLIYCEAQTQEAAVNELYELAESLQQAVRQYLKLSISIGISRPFRRMEAAAYAYKEAQEALEYRIQLGSGAILYIDDVHRGQTLSGSHTTEAIQDIVQALKLTDRDTTDRLLKEFVNHTLGQPFHPDQVRLAFVQLLIELIKIVQDSDRSVSTFEGRNVLDELHQQKTAAEIERWFREEVVTPIMDSLLQERQGQYKDISEQMLNLIHEKYDSDLTLEWCAAQMNYHPNYLKRVFRMKTGWNFRDYLMDYRLQMSKKWLLETDMSIHDISIRLKYNSPTNFIRYFRKMEGLTPGKYREQFKRHD